MRGLFSRQRSIFLRLRIAFGLFAGILLVVAWIVGLTYFLVFERRELRQAVRLQAAILATQNEAAMMFRDSKALAEDLKALRHWSPVRWATAATADGVLAGYGDVPDEMRQPPLRIFPRESVDERMTGLTVRQPVIRDGVVHGAITLHADYGELNRQFFTLATVSFLLIVLSYWLALRFHGRMAATVIEPLRELSKVAEEVATQAQLSLRADASWPDEAGRLASAFNNMLDRLADRQGELIESRDQLRALGLRLQVAREEERGRIAHAIHDELGQRLTTIKLAVARLGGGDAAAREKELAELPGLIDATVRVVREISWELRPSVLDALGLPSAIEWLAQDFGQRMGIRCKAVIPPDLPEPAPELATDLFRICQEALTNVARHAEANRVDIRLEERDGLRLTVADNGIGLPADFRQHQSLGLLGMRERALRWGGAVVFGPGPEGRGTCIEVRIPRFTGSNNPKDAS